MLYICVVSNKFHWLFLGKNECEPLVYRLHNEKLTKETMRRNKITVTRKSSYGSHDIRTHENYSLSLLTTEAFVHFSSQKKLSTSVYA